MTVRQVFYEATVRGFEKAESGYGRRISRSCAGQNCLGAAAMTRPRCRPRTLFLKEETHPMKLRAAAGKTDQLIV